MEPNMPRIKSVGVLSSAKISGIIYTCLGLMFIPLALVGGVAGLASGQKNGVLGGIGFLAIAVLAPIFYGVLGFVGGAIGAFIYNLAAKWVGGIEIELEGAVSPGSPVGLVSAGPK